MNYAVLLKTMMMTIAVILIAAPPVQAANQADLVSRVAGKAGISEAAAELAMKAMFAEIKASMLAGEEVAIDDFGTFAIVQRKERVGRNPQTGAEFRISAKKVAKFKAGFAVE